jgi:hypothetical protein
MGPDSTVGPTSWSSNSNDVTIPKLPPPPLRPQKRSSFSLSLGRAEIVDCQTVLSREPAPPAAERQAGDTSRRIVSNGRREAERLGLVVEFVEHDAGFDAGSLPIRVDADRIHRG